MGLTRIRAEQISNIDYKQAVRVVTTTDVTLSGGAPVVVDGVTLLQGNRVLVAGQENAAQNGIYIVQTLGTGEDGTWIRATDANQTGEIEPGMVVMVTEGTTYADTPWKLITNGNIIIGTTALTFQQFSSGANVGGVDTNIQFNSSGNLAGSSNFTWDGTELYVNAAANITGNVTGNYFFGNGSQLSGIITSVANINNGDSNVSIAEANANITMSVDGTANVVVVSATGLTVNGNITGNGIPTTTVSNTAPANPEQGDIWIDSDTGTQLIYFSSGGNSQWAEMEADQSFTTDSGTPVDLTAVSSNILPTANITYDIGNTTNRFRDIYLANSTIYLGEAQISATDGAIVLPANSTVGGSVLVASPLISAINYPGDDTAADPAGGQTISIEGSNFQSGAAVYVDGGLVGVVSFISSSILQFVSPAKLAGSYSLYVVNPNGSTAIAVPGIQYSGTPTWSTAAGSLGTPYETTAFNTTVVATGDAPITYSVAAGNSLPTDMTLTSANGYLSVASVPVTNNDTTYNFNIMATDVELQDTPRQFSVTYKTDVVTWDSPAEGSSYAWAQNAANSVSLSATSAAGKAITYTVDSGSLPANVTISGNLITGTPNTIQSNTSVVIKATAADTARFANRTLYFTVISAGPTVIGEAYGGGYYGGLMKIGESQYYLIVSPKETGQNILAVKTDTSSDFGNNSDYDGYTNTNLHNDAAHPAFQWARSLTIGGYTDWYIPAPYEFLILYFNLKPTTDINAAAPWGWNPFSLSPYTPLDSSWWKVGNPAQTPLADWQVNGAQSIANPTYSNRFWSSMQVPNNAANIVRIDMRSGLGYDGLTPNYQSSPKTTALPVRAIRKILKT